jgi:hypothetical protein
MQCYSCSMPTSAPLLAGEEARNRLERRSAFQPAAKTRHSWASDLINCFFHFLYPLVEFLFCGLAGVAILLLEQADYLFGIAIRLFQLIVGDLAPPLFDLALHFLPLAFENILVHNVILLILRISCPCYLHRRSGHCRAGRPLILSADYHRLMNGR